ncbi:hypothetical protein CK203_073791 [Vitis vinifera]|uniref:Uncharacterized protein n=1 Tax=Vitis vinifera TaxID=29760 RepID=A0A438DJC6_VITVI|nr:hypothetical protein CK203_073791 [Vitis vinifera]
MRHSGSSGLHLHVQMVHGCHVKWMMRIGKTGRSWLSGLSTNDVVLGLIIANVAVFMLWRISDHRFMLNNFTVSSWFIN